jgi:hypothetical protein
MPENAKRTLFHIEYVGSREKAPYWVYRAGRDSR